MYEYKYGNAMVLIGRILMATIFIMSGIQKITNWSGTAQMMEAQGMPMVPLFLAGAAAMEILGGLSILTGFAGRWGALGLALYLIPVTLIFHDFWNVPAAEVQMQTINFLKNLAIIGGLLILSAYGPGKLSIGKRETYIDEAARREKTTATPVG